MPPHKLMVVPRILWAAIFASTFLLLLVLYLSPPEDIEPQASFAAILGVVALAVVVLSFVLPRWLHTKGAAAAKLTIEEVPDPNASVILRDEAPKIRVFADHDAAVRKAMVLYQTPLILRLALTESIAVYGLVLGFSGHGWSVVLPFFATSWVLFALRFPRSSEALKTLEEGQNAKFHKRV